MHRFRPALCAILAMLCTPARAQSGTDAARLIGLINALRAAPGVCAGAPALPAPPLTPQPALAAVELPFGRFLDQALEDAGLPVARAEAITLSGADTAADAFAALRAPRCRILLDPGYSAVGVRHRSTEWQIVLAQPAPQDTLRVLRPDWRQVGQEILAAVNAARARPQLCGDTSYAAAPPLRWNAALGAAAYAHSAYMAAHRSFSHRESDGSQAAERAQRAGYLWRRIGENIASGQESAAEAVAGWLASPGHCANLMTPGFREMGAAYALDPQRRHAAIYWTQVFGTPR